MTTFKKKTLSYRLGKFWDKYFLDWKRELLIKVWIEDLIYKIDHLIFRPWNVLKITTLPRTSYRDPNEVILHANFQILVNFIEKGFNYNTSNCVNRSDLIHDVDKAMEEFTNWDEEEKQKHRQMLEDDNKITNELFDLYEWWKFKRPNREKNSPFFRGIS